MAILSTPKGVMSGQEARRNEVGGEVIFPGEEGNQLSTGADNCFALAVDVAVVEADGSKLDGGFGLDEFRF